jgi:type IX secretion system PorP/SprF family membrane protein
MTKLIIVLLLFVATANAQQKPYYTQVVMNNFILNPAVSGIESYTDVKLSYRNQWTNMTGAPVTSYLSVHGPIGKSRYSTTATSFERNGENPRGKSFLDNYTVAPAHHGIGAVIINDKTGFLNRFSAYATYAYHQPLGVKTALAAGIQVGYSSITLDRSKIVWGSLDPSDKAISYQNGDLVRNKVDMGLGLWLYSTNYYVGLSALNIIPGKIRFSDSTRYGNNFAPHFFVTTGLRFLLNDDISILPSVGLLAVKPQPTMLMVNTKIQYRDLLWIGANYRYSDLLGGLGVMAGVNVRNIINISYAYDNATTARLKSYVGNTHEVVIGFILGNKYDDSCPKNFW